MFPGNSRGKNSLNIKMWIHRTHNKFRYLTIDNYHVYNFQGGGGGQGVVKLYTTTEDFLCFCLYFSSSKSSSMKYAGQGFLCFFFFSCILLAGKHGQKKNHAIKWFSQNAKDSKSKDCCNQPFYLPCKELLITHIVSNRRDFNFFLIFKNPSLTF